MADKGQESKKRTIIIVILVLIGGFMAWQIKGMFGSSEEAEQVKIAAATPPPTPMPTPKPAELPATAAPLTQREAELLQLQQETEAKYIAAVNELQMLKVQRDIAETNKAIASAKLDTVNSQKNIVTILTPEQNTNYGQRLSGIPQNVPTGQPTQSGPSPIVEVAYTVVSVTEIQGRWGAIIGAQGKLFNVHVGDVLPSDNSKVVSIDRSGVVLEKDGMKRTISLVSII